MEEEKGTNEKREVRKRIILKSLQLFTTHGIKSIRMDDIANELRMSKRTLYEIFVDKETLLFECLLYHKNVMDIEAKELVEKSKNVLEVILKCYQRSVEAYHKVNKSFFEDIKKYPKAYEEFRHGRERDNRETVKFFKQGVDQGLFRDDINFAILQALVREQMNLLVNTDVFSQEYDFLEVYESIMFVYLRGISTPKGAMELDAFIKEFREKKMSEKDDNQDYK